MCDQVALRTSASGAAAEMAMLRSSYLSPDPYPPPLLTYPNPNPNPDPDPNPNPNPEPEPEPEPNQVSALLDAYFAPDAFAALPALPGATGLKAFAMEAKMRSKVEGTLDKIDAQKMARIRALKSYQDEMIAVEVAPTPT